jgi:hypothetical protein
MTSQESGLPFKIDKDCTACEGSFEAAGEKL